MKQKPSSNTSEKARSTAKASGENKLGKFIIVGVLGLGGAGAFYFFKPGSPAPKKDHEVFEELSAQIRSQSKNAMSSPAAKAWDGADINFIREQMNGDDENKRLNFLQSSVFYISQTPTTEENKAARLEVLDVFTQYIDANHETFRGPKARSVVLASRLIASLPSPAEGSPTYNKLVQLSTNPKIKEPVGPLMLEAVLGWESVPKSVVNSYRTSLYSKNPTTVMSALQMLPKINDEKTRQTILSELRSSFKSITPLAQPLTLKTLAQSTPPSAALDELIAYAGSKSAENESSQWPDAYVFAIEKMQRLPASQSMVLNTIAEKDENPIVRERAKLVQSQIKNQLQKGEGK